MSSYADDSRRRGGLCLAIASVVAGAMLIAGGTRAVGQVDPCNADDSPPRADFIVSCVLLPGSAVCDPEKSQQRRFTNVSSAPEGLAGIEWDFGDGVVITQEPSQLATPIDHPFSSSGVFLVSLTVQDASEGSATATQFVSVGASGPGLATDDEFEVAQGQQILLPYSDLLVNDAAGVRFNALESNATSGTVLNQPTLGRVLYLSPANFEGVAVFTYSVTNGFEQVGIATVSIHVVRPLIANPDSFTIVGINNPYSPSTSPPPLRIRSKLDLLANDSPGAVFAGVQNLLNGSLTYLGANETEGHAYNFVGAPFFAGFASFEYQISWDGNPPYVLGQVTIEIKDAPPHADFTATCVNLVCTFGNNSTDDLGIATFAWQWGDGQSATTDGSMQTHSYATSGRKTVRLTVTDTTGQVDFTERDVVPNTPPVAIDDVVEAERDVAVTIPVLANDSDADAADTNGDGIPDTEPLIVHSVTLTHPGAAFQVIPYEGKWAIRFTPPDTYLGLIGGTYVVSDPWGGSDTGAFTVDVKQPKSILDAVGEQFSMAQNGIPLSLPKATLLSNDYNEAEPCTPLPCTPVPDNTMTITSVDTSMLMGTLNQSDPTKYTYTPPLNGAGFTFFRYTAHDATGHHDTAIVRIYVGYPNTPPTAVDDWFTGQSQTTKTFTRQDVAQNDIDPVGDTLTILNLTGAPQYGSITCLPFFIYSCTYTPLSGPAVNGAGFVGADRFPYQVTDGLSPAVTGYINMLTLPTPGLVANQKFDAREDVVAVPSFVQTSISYGVLKANDFDPETQPTTITAAAIDKTGMAGTMTCDATGCSYKSPAGFNGTTRFKYTATDSQGNTDTALVKIRVGTVANAAPVVGPQEQFTTPRNVALTFSVFDLLKNDYDPNNDPLTVTVYPVSPKTARRGTMDCGTPSYWCTFKPNNPPDPNHNPNHIETVTYAVSDGVTTTTSTLKITITAPITIP